VSFTQDLGISSASLVDQTTLLNIVSPLPTVTLPAANATLAGLLAGGTSGFQWNVTAGNTATQTILTTATTATTPATVAALTDSALTIGLGNYQTYLAGVNAAAGTNNFASVTGATNNAYAGLNVFGSNWSGNTKFGSTAAIGSALNFFFATTSGTGTAVTQQFTSGTNALQFNLASNGTLTFAPAAVAAVPEPSEWLLMLSGFGLVGFIASRRKNLGNKVSFA
jgi:hypothetical protein